MSFQKLILSLLALITLSLSPIYGATGNIDATTQYQQIEGFGASGAWNEGRLTNHPLKSQLYDILFGQLGLDIYRVRNVYNQTGDATYMTRTGEIVTEGEASLGRPLKILISSWSPPSNLKSNNSLVGGTLAGGPSNYVYNAFAQWWYDSIVAFSGYGVDADYISMQNDPNIVATWDSCRFRPTEDSSFAGYDTAFETVWQKLNTEMGSAMPKMLAPETVSISIADWYIDSLINDSHVYGYGHHLQDASLDAPDDIIPIMEDFLLNYGDKPRIQTEFARQEQTSAITYADAMNLAILIHNSLTVEEVSAFLYWELFWASPKGLVSLPASGSTYTINPVYYSFKHYSAFIDSGWERIGAATNDDPNLRISAYINPDQNEISVVIINTTPSTSIDLSLSFTGFIINDGDVYRTTSTQNCVLLGSFSNPITLPANSITTLALDVLSGPQQTLNVSSTTGGSVIIPGEGDFTYPQDSNAAIVAEADQFYHFVNWTGSAADAGKVADVNAISTTVFMDANYAVVANFELDPPDETAPEPDPMTWESEPNATGPTTITMTATTATDDSLPVEYYFECTNDGSKSSAWQSSPTYIAQGLNPLTTYRFRVKARDSYLTPNETRFSDERYATTWPIPSEIEIIGAWVAGTTHAVESGTNRVLIFIAHGELVDPINLSSVTYGGQEMTKVMEYNYNAASGYAYAVAFILKESGIDAASSSTFSPTWSGSAPGNPMYASAFFGNVDQTDSIGATGTGGSTTNPVTTSSSLATSDGDMVILGATCGNGGSYTVNNGFTEGIDQTLGGTYGNTGVTGHKAATGANETPSATYSSTINRQMIIGFVLQAVAIDYPPTAPTGLTATAGNDTVALDWNDNNEPDLAGYNVYRSTTQGSGYGKINSLIVTDSNYTDNDVNNGTPYYYVVTAVDGGSNQSDYSNEASATPDFQTCGDVKAGGYGFVSDFTGDCYVDMNDLAVIAQYWLHNDCAGLDNCGGSDLEPDGDVDLFDYSDFALDWLNCNNPQDSNCPANW